MQVEEMVLHVENLTEETVCKVDGDNLKAVQEKDAEA
jgi:hypothetical protein